MKIPELRTCQPTLKQQLGLIDALTVEYAKRPRTKRNAERADLLDGLANWISTVNQGLEAGTDVLIYRAGRKA